MFGEQVRGARKQRGLTRDQLAERIQVQPCSISRIENGTRGVDVVTLNRLVEELDLDPAAALRGAAETAQARSNRPDSHVDDDVVDLSSDDTDHS